jgi:hypothetical protein
MAENVFDRARAIQGSSLTMGQKFLALLLNQFCGENGECWPSHQTLARAMSCSDRAVRKWQGELESRGVVRLVQGGGRGSANRYSLDLSRLPENPEPRSAFVRQEPTGNPEPRSVFSSDVPTLNPEPRSAKPGTSFQKTRNHVPPNRIKKDQENKEARAGVSIPDSLASSSEFLAAWKDWLAYRRERKKTLAPQTQAKQLAKLATWGALKAVHSIERSIEQGWQGLFDPEEQRGSAGGPAGSLEAAAAWDRFRQGLKRFGGVGMAKIREGFEESTWPRVWDAVKAAGGVQAIEQRPEQVRPAFVAAFDRTERD